MAAPGDLPSFNPNPSFGFTQPPNPSWSIGDKTEKGPLGPDWNEGEKEGWTVLDTQSMDPMKLYAVMISGIIPRPIAFVSSMSETGSNNLAPFSWFNMISPNPPTVMISCTHQQGRPNDTATNILAIKEFTVNIISEPFAEAANFASINAPAGHSEWPGSGLTMAPSVSVKPPRVRESAFSMECELSNVVNLHAPGTTMVTQSVLFGLVKKIHIRNDIKTEKGTADPRLLRPIARLGDITYARLGEGFRILRPNWQNLGDAVVTFEKKAEGAE